MKPGSAALLATRNAVTINEQVAGSATARKVSRLRVERLMLAQPLPPGKNVTARTALFDSLHPIHSLAYRWIRSRAARSHSSRQGGEQKLQTLEQAVQAEFYHGCEQQ